MGVIIRQSIKGTIVNYLGAFIGFLTTFFIITKYLTESEIGLLNVLISAGTVFSGLALMGTSSSIIRFYPDFKNSKNKDNGYFFWAILIPFIGYVVFSILNYFFKDWICNYFSDRSQLFVDYFYLVFPLTFFVLYITVFESYSNVLMRIVVPKLVREVILRIVLLISYLLYAFNFVSFNNFVNLFCLSYAIAALINLGYLIKLKQISIKPNLKPITSAFKKEYFKYTIYSLIISFGTTLSPMLSTFFVAGTLGLNYNGIYAIATYMATIVEIPYRSLGTIAQPELAKLLKKGETDNINVLCKQVSLHQFIVGAFILFVLWINIDIVFEIIPNGDKYSSGKIVVLLLGIGKLLNSVVAFGATVLNYSKFFFYSILFTIINTFASLLLNMYLTPILGIDGAALATLLTSIIYYVPLLWFVMYKTKINLLSISHLKVLGLMLLLLTLNYGIDFITSFISNNSFFISLIIAILKTGLLCLIGVIAIYKLKISKNINQIIDTLLNKIINKKI